MVRKPRSKGKLADAERHERFVAMAREVGASESPKAFDKAFRQVAGKPHFSQKRNKGPSGH